MNVLTKIKRGGENLPPRVLLAGPEGIGKSTYGASAPSPLFVSQEDGLTGLDHIARIHPSSFAEILMLIDQLKSGSEFKTLVIDTMDWLERAIHQFICARDGKQNVEDYGYGKGYKIAEQELVTLLSKLDALRHAQKIGIVLLAHVHIRTFIDPTGNSWDRYEMKGHKGFTGILREWPDACLFATYEVFKHKERGSNIEKVIGGDRIIRTNWSPGWDAKNRLNLPEVLPMPEENGYGVLMAAVHDNKPETLRKEFLALLSTSSLSEEDRAKWVTVDPETVPVARIRNGIGKLKTLQPK
ncbi:MAG TPA: ATP-binding protein [Terrimicrobiaceae bacterium]